MNIIVRLLGAFAILLPTYAAVSSFAVAQESPTILQPGTMQKPPTSPLPGTTPKTPTTPLPGTTPKTPTTPLPGTTPKTPTTPLPGTTPKTPTTPLPGTIQKTPTTPLPGTIQKTPTTPQSGTTQKVCSFDAVDNLLPPPTGEQNRSPLSYLAQQGFTPKLDGSWVCYVRDNQKQDLYYTLFKVQQVNGKLIASSFLNNSNLIEGQDTRTVDLFLLLVNNHTKTNQGNRQSIQRYFESFISLVKQGKIPPSARGYLFDQPNRGFIIYNTVTGGDLKGTAITININSPQNLGSPPAS